MATQAKIVLSAEDRASRVIGNVRAEMGRAAKSADALATSAGLVNPAFAALASVAGLVAFTKRVLDAGAALKDLSEATGASIESLSGLENVARRGGGSLDDAANTLIKFNQALNLATDANSDAAQVFRNLGLSLKDLQNDDPAVALQKTAIALQGFADDGAKARAIQVLFSRSIKEAAPFLNELADAGELNATITREQALQADRFNKSLFAMQTLAGDAGRALTFGLVDVLGTLIERYKTAAGVFGGLQGILKAGLFEKLNFADAAEGLREYNDKLAIVDRSLRDIADGKTGGLGATKEMIEQRVQGLQKERAEIAKVVDYYRTLLNAGSPGGAGRGGGAGPARPSLPGLDKGKAGGKEQKDTIAEAERALAAYVDQLDRELQKTQELTTEQEALNQLKRLGALGEVPQVRELLLGLAQQVQLKQDQADLDKAITAELQRQAQAQAALDTALDNFSGRTADALKRLQTARLEARLAAGEVFSPEELDRIVQGIAGIQLKAEEATDTMQIMLEQFAKNAQDALGQTLEDTLRGNFDSIGRLWGNLLLKMAAQAAAAQLGPALFGDFAKGGQVGGVFGTLIGSVFGLSPGKAGGGSVEPYSLQRVNERGFEVFTDGRGGDWLMAGGGGGRVTPNSQVQMAASAAPVTVVQHISIGAGVGRNEVMAAMAATKAQTLAAVADAQRRRYAGAAA